MIKLYLDTCCYNRPFDDLKQEKIRMEAQAIINIIKLHNNGKIEVYKSRAIEFEINKILNSNKRRQVDDLYNAVKAKNITYSYELDKRVLELEEFNIHFMDAYHISYAESKI